MSPRDHREACETAARLGYELAGDLNGLPCFIVDGDPCLILERDPDVRGGAWTATRAVDDGDRQASDADLATAIRKAIPRGLR